VKKEKGNPLNQDHEKLNNDELQKLKSNIEQAPISTTIPIQSQPTP